MATRTKRPTALTFKTTSARVTIEFKKAGDMMEVVSALREVPAEAEAGRDLLIPIVMLWRGTISMGSKPDVDSIMGMLNHRLRRFDVSSLTPGSLEAGILEAHRARFHALQTSIRNNVPESLPIIEFEYYEDGHVNGLAVLQGDVNAYVFLPAQGIFKIYDTFFRIMSCPSFFPHLGTSALEEAKPFHSGGFAGSYTDLLANRGVDFRNLSSVRPKCPDRSLHAFRLASIAIDFLIQHEIAHILFGHLRRNPSGASLRCLSESTNVPDSYIDPAMLNRQAIELHADLFGIARVIRLHCADANDQFFLERMRLEGRIPGDDPTGKLPTPHDYLLLDCLVAFYMLLWMFGFGVDLGTIGQYEHPPTWTRYFTCLDARKHKIDLGIDIEKSFNFAFANASFMASSAHEALNGGKEDPAFDLLEQPETVTALARHNMTVYDELKRIIPELDRVSYFPNSLEFS